jgi:uncharacterized membrane protein (UPF0127 family)
MNKAKPNKPTLYSLIIAAVILVTALVLRLVQTVETPKPVLAEVTVAGRTFQVEVADTAAKRTQGLSGRASLALNQAMYFPMPRPDIWAFWMKDMKFPLDIVWIRSGKVIGVAAEVPQPTGNEVPRTVMPDSPADAVLEINSNVAAQSSIVPGVDVTLRTLGK